MSGGYSPDICGSVLNTACMCYQNANVSARNTIIIKLKNCCRWVGKIA